MMIYLFVFFSCPFFISCHIDLPLFFFFLPCTTIYKFPRGEKRTTNGVNSYMLPLAGYMWIPKPLLLLFFFSFFFILCYVFNGVFGWVEILGVFKVQKNPVF
ncbi:hypothetical protein DFH27DRAFT_542446 [Peziza echinospora]|nr:hypothetical protein DFH27DRAFT_542446 [Peziza echinospora]